MVTHCGASEQCGKLEPLHAFDGTRRNCRVQVAKRRAKSLGKRASFSASADGSSSAEGASSRLDSLLKSRGGIRKSMSHSGGLDKLLLQEAQLLQEQQQQQQVLLQQPQISQDEGQGTDEEEDVKARLTKIKQQLAHMEQHLAVLQQQQAAETQLAAMQQHYGHYGQLLHQQHAHSIGLPLPLHVSGPDLAAMHNSGAFAAAAAGAAMAAVAPVDTASAPISAVHPGAGAHTACVPLLGAMRGWHLAGGAVPQQQELWPAHPAGSAAGYSANLPPIGSSSSSALPPLTMPQHHGMLPAQAAAAAAGFSAPMPRFASLPGRLPPGWSGTLPDSRAGNSSSAAGASQPLPAAVHPGLFNRSQSAGAGAVAGASGGAGAAQPQHIPCLHVDDIALLLLEDGANDIPDLEAFLAAGGNLLQDEGHGSGELSSDHQALLTHSHSSSGHHAHSHSSGHHAMQTHSGQHSSGHHAMQTHSGQHSSGHHAMQTHSGQHSSGQHTALTHPAPAHGLLKQAASPSSQQACSSACAVRQAAAGSAPTAGAGRAVQGLLEAAGRGSAVPPWGLPPAWAQLPPACPPAGRSGAGAAAAGAAAAAAAVNVFSRRPGNNTQQYKPGRSSLDMFTGLLEDVVAEIHAEQQAIEAAAAGGGAAGAGTMLQHHTAHLQGGPSSQQVQQQQHQQQGGNFFHETYRSRQQSQQAFRQSCSCLGCATAASVGD